MIAVETERRDGVLVVTLNRPAAHNAVDAALAAGVAAALDELDGDPALRVGVLTGAGGTFCAGLDVRAFARGESAGVGAQGLAGLTRRARRRPLVAAVEGVALGGGLELALACDLIVAARGARLGLPEVRRGLIAGEGGLLRLPTRLAGELALTGEPLPAERLHALGVVSRLTEPGEALRVALGVAAAIAEGGPLAVAATRRVLDERASSPEDDAWARQDAVARTVFASAEALEGARAFVERRPPRWP